MHARAARHVCLVLGAWCLVLGAWLRMRARDCFLLELSPKRHSFRFLPLRHKEVRMTRTRPAVVEKQKEKKRKERKKKTRGGGRKKRGREERRRRTEERKREETGHNQFCVCVMRAGGLQKGAVSKDKFFCFFFFCYCFCHN